MNTMIGAKIKISGTLELMGKKGKKYASYGYRTYIGPMRIEPHYQFA